MTFRRQLLAGIAAAVAAFCAPWHQAHAVVCYYIVDDPAWQGEMTAVTNGLEQGFDIDTATMLSDFTFQLQRMVSAVKVEAEQTNVNGSQATTAMIQGMQAYADAVNQQMLSDQIVQAWYDFGPQGMSVDPCGSVVMLANVSKALDGANGGAVRRLDPALVYTAPGSGVTGQQAISKRLSLHQQRYCSPSEAAAGLCAATGANPAADVDASTLFDPATDEQTADAFLNNIAGNPLTKPTAANSGKPDGVYAMARAQRAEAVRSPALVSLAAVRSVSAGDLSGSGAPPVSQALDQLVQTYGGGPGYDAWYQAVATRDSHGLLQELNKLRAIGLRLQSFQSDSNSRMATALAALLAYEADSLQ